MPLPAPPAVERRATRPAPGPPAHRPPAPASAGSVDEPASLRGLYGRLWPLWIGVALVGAFALAANVPLDDPDLGMHLALGEWIVRHEALPRTEPFAWTRAGAPFYAYSWLPEVAYYAALRGGGPAMLHALQGAVALAGVVAAWCLARVAGWSRWAALLLGAAHLVVVYQTALALRPHGVLGACVPAAWAAALAIARALGRPSAAAPSGAGRSGPSWRPYAVWWAATALAANSHLLAPLMAAPLVLLVPHLRRHARAVLGAAGAVAAGLVATPYARDWPAVFRLNFAPNALFSYPSSLTEHTPGVVWLARDGDLLAGLTVAGLLAVVWAPRGRSRVWTAGADRLLVVAWTVGLLLFASALRGLFLWWLLALPIVGAALARLPAPSDELAGRATRALVLLLPWVLAARVLPKAQAARPFEGTAERRVLPAATARGAFALADTLDARAPGRGGHLLTTFDYGSALTWRLPRYSMSIDGRTIFPDSAALADSYIPGLRAAAVPLPVASADVAIVPLGSVADARLGTSPGWVRLAVARPTGPSVVVDSAALWVRARWLRPPPGAGTGDRARVQP